MLKSRHVRDRRHPRAGEAGRRRSIPARVNAIAESMLEAGQTTPILVRPDGDGFVLVEGLHRLEAKKALGETTIEGYLVQARKH